jgi:hypothetical protein
LAALLLSPFSIQTFILLCLGNNDIRDRRSMTTFQLTEIAPLHSQKAIALLLPKKRSPLAFLSQAMAVLKFNQEDNGDRTTFFGIPLTAAINVHGAFPKSDRWSSRTCIRERTLRLSYTLFFFVS